MSDRRSGLDFVCSNVWYEIFQNFPGVGNPVPFSPSLKGVKSKRVQSFSIIATFVTMNLPGERLLDILYLLDEACFNWTPKLGTIVEDGKNERLPERQHQLWRTRLECSEDPTTHIPG
jgi:hypothetical protein